MYVTKFDASVLAMLTTTEANRVTEVTWVLRGDNGRTSVYVEDPDGTNTRHLASFDVKDGDKAMTFALQYNGWGSLALTDALDAEGR
jgi:hypothetical protein